MPDLGLTIFQNGPAGCKAFIDNDNTTLKLFYNGWDEPEQWYKFEGSNIKRVDSCPRELVRSEMKQIFEVKSHSIFSVVTDPTLSQTEIDIIKCGHIFERVMIEDWSHPTLGGDKQVNFLYLRWIGYETRHSVILGVLVPSDKVDEGFGVSGPRLVR